MKVLCFIIPLLVIVSCLNNNQAKENYLNRSYIISSEEVKRDCFNSIIDFLSPLNIEDEKNKITRIHKLNIELDTNIYKKNKIAVYIFLGITFNNDFDYQSVKAIDTVNGYVYNCIPLKKLLLIINTSVYRHNFGSISLNSCIGIPNKDFQINRELNDRGYWNMGFSSGLIGNWSVQDDWDLFQKKSFNKVWSFHGNMNKHWLSFNNDSIRNDFKIENNRININDKQTSLEIIHVSSHSLILYDVDNDLYHHLKKNN